MYRILSNIIINKFEKIEIKLQQLCIEYMNTIAYFIFLFTFNNIKYS